MDSLTVLTPPHSPMEPVTDVFHGFPVTDPYRWLEDQNAPKTRAWIEEQTCFARTYLDNLPARERIAARIREFLAVETYDSLQIAGGRYFFRKRLPDQEQPCIYMRAGADGEDHLLVDPSERDTGKYTAVKPLRVSPDGRLLLFEVKEGGERTGTFELLEINSRKRLPDLLPRGYLRGFAFAPDGKSFYYVHEGLDAKRPFYRAAFRHILGTPFEEDKEVFYAGEDEKVRLHVISDANRIAFLVYHFLDKVFIDFLLQPFGTDSPPTPILQNVDYTFGPMLLNNRIFAITDRDATNRRIVELRHESDHQEPVFVDVVPEADTKIQHWRVVGDLHCVSYLRGTKAQIALFDFTGKKVADVPIRDDETVRLSGCSPENPDVLFEAESFTEPVSIYRYSASSGQRSLWAKKQVPFDSTSFDYIEVSYASKDGTLIPMFLMGAKENLLHGTHPVIMTSYGGYGVPMTPQFSVFVAFLVERGCLFALPNIRGGSEFGLAWQNAAKRRSRQTAYDDFIGAAEWLIKTGRTTPDRLAIFGGSNSGLLVGVALTQRPDLFRAVLCMVPMLDMLRYHLFDNAHVWKDEFGTSDDPEDFAALIGYSPYQKVRNGVAYPATMLVSGDADRNCNPLHARKMTARLQAANVSPFPVLLDYSPHRGHSPVLPLSERVAALTDRMAFLCHELQIPV
jgi:prolyl oligopeptidase